MQDPEPSNIHGSKTHTVEHHIRWDYVVIAVVAVLVLWKIGLLFNQINDDSDETEVPV